MYNPSSLPAGATLEELKMWAVNELQLVSDALQDLKTDKVQFDILHVEPPKVIPGLVVYADGTDWDPGDGPGLYRWDGDSWEFVG